MPKNEILRTEAVENGIKLSYEGVDASDKAYTMAFSAKHEGKDYPLSGDPYSDAVVVKKIDTATSGFVLKEAGNETGRGRIVVSRDGKTQTLTFEATKPQGQERSAAWVYDNP
jgi:hypothetical protein